MNTVMLLALCVNLGTDPVVESVGVLYQPAFSLGKELIGPAQPYVPQAGDIILESDDRIVWTVGHNLAKTSHPHHSAIVFQRPDGTFATVQAGGFDPAPGKVGILDLKQHLCYEEAKNGRSERRDRRVWVRQRRVPLTPEQSAALTQFALEVEGRRFARGRLLLLMTPWRAKGLVRTIWLGKPDFERSSFFCSELVTTALVAAGALNAELVRPAATFPRDLFFGSCLNPHINRSVKPLNEEWEPPARWVSQ